MAVPLSPRSVNTLKGVNALTISTEQFVKIHILTSQAASAITEKKFDRGITIGQFKGKLELLTGCSPATMTLQLENVKGEKIGEMNDDGRLLGSYQVDNGCSVRVTDPNGFDWNECKDVEKQDMDEETYNSFKPTSVKPTVREYKRKHKMGRFNPEFQKQAVEDFEQREAQDALDKERIHVGKRCEIKLKTCGKQRGTVKFIGETEFKPDLLWIGVQLDEPFGKNNGAVGGKSYFCCPDKYGVFARPDTIEIGDFPQIDELDFSDDEI